MATSLTSAAPIAWGPPHPLLDVPLVTAPELARLEDRAAALLGTQNDTVVLGAEAVLPLEAITASLGGPALEWLNVVTSPYGRVFGDLLRSRGTQVHDVITPNNRPVRVEEIETALARWPAINAMAIVHAESLIGIVNPLEEALALAAGRGILTVVDAVASAGAEPLEVDALEIDMCVVGPQKGWGGPPGASVLSVSARAWDRVMANSAASRGSVLSLADIKERWIDAGRSRVLGTPPPLELTALGMAMARLEDEGIGAVIARHRTAAAATRAGLGALGLELWVGDERDACAVATPVRLPAGTDTSTVLARVRDQARLELTPGTGELADIAVRIDHMGARACLPFVSAAVTALGVALNGLGAEVDVGGGLAAVARVYEATTSPF
jgi:aspartate aminotransferase-like enzyme